MPSRLSSSELAAELAHTAGITPGHAAEFAAAHGGTLRADVKEIPPELPDRETVWARCVSLPVSRR